MSKRNKKQVILGTMDAHGSQTLPELFAKVSHETGQSMGQLGSYVSLLKNEGYINGGQNGTRLELTEVGDKYVDTYREIIEEGDPVTAEPGEDNDEVKFPAEVKWPDGDEPLETGVDTVDVEPDDDDGPTDLPDQIGDELREEFPEPPSVIPGPHDPARLFIASLLDGDDEKAVFWLKECFHEEESDEAPKEVLAMARVAEIFSKLEHGEKYRVFEWMGAYYNLGYKVDEESS